MNIKCIPSITNSVCCLCTSKKTGWYKCRFTLSGNTRMSQHFSALFTHTRAPVHTHTAPVHTHMGSCSHTHGLLLTHTWLLLTHTRAPAHTHTGSCSHTHGLLLTHTRLLLIVHRQVAWTQATF